jgi:hypothetical protein
MSIMPVKYSIFKDLDFLRSRKSKPRSPNVNLTFGLRSSDFGLLLLLVGLGRIELPTSPLSGVRSSQLSYRPGLNSRSNSGGAGRDRTGDLLNANQALSQLSYSPRKSSEADWTQGSRRPASRPLTKTSDTPRRDPERDTTTL